MSVRIPKYRLHKGSGQALVQINGERIYLGKHGTEQSKEKYRRIVAESLGNPQHSPPLPQRADQVGAVLSISGLILAYWKFVETYYQRDGEPTSELGCLRDALKPLRQLYGRTPAAKFGPRSLKTVRQAMIDADLSRGVINARVGRIKRLFKWGVAEELIPPGVYHGLEAVPGLRKGRTAARESEPVLPVADAVVDATLPHLPNVLADMIRFQRLTGCRPTEACVLRPGDVDRSGEIWEYRPGAHKTQHHGRERIIFIGPRAQEVLQRYLLRPAIAYCFSPVDSERARNEERRANRKSPMTPSQAKRRPKKNRCRPPRDRYDRNSYRRAIHRACGKAGVGKWSPNQLRHTAATQLRRRFGVEAAQVVLGHAEAAVTQVYAERDYDLARRVMGEVG